MPNATHQLLLKSEEAFSTALVTMVLDDFGVEALTWAPQTIVMELETNYQTQISSANLDRLMAGIHLVTSNSFYVSLPDFNDLCNVLSWEPITPGVFIPADAASCAWGITEAMLLSPPDDLDNAFTDEIRAYVGAAVKEEGILSPPDVLRIADLDKEVERRVRYDFTDDPVMFEAIFTNEADKTKEINEFIKKRLRALVTQLSSLHLKNGSVEQIAEKMLKALPVGPKPL